MASTEGAAEVVGPLFSEHEVDPAMKRAALPARLSFIARCTPRPSSMNGKCLVGRRFEHLIRRSRAFVLFENEIPAQRPRDGAGGGNEPLSRDSRARTIGAEEKLIEELPPYENLPWIGG